MAGVDAVDLGRDRQQDRHRHDQAGDAVDHRADHQQDDVDQQHEGHRILGDRLDRGRDRLRDLAVDQHPGEHGGGGDEEEHDRRVDAGTQHHLRQLAELELLGPIAADQQSRDRADSGRLSRIGEAAEDRADDDDRDQQGRGRAQHDPGALAQGELVAGRVVVDEAHAGDDQEEQDGQEHARHDAGHQHVADRDLGQNGIDDEHHRGRDDRAEHAAIGGEAGGEVLVVALALHFGDHDLRHDRDLCRGRAEDRGDEHVGEDVDIGQPALERADEGHGEVDDAARDAAAIHDLADQDEERDGDQPVAVDAAEHLQRVVRQELHVAGRRHIDEGAQAEAQRDRHAGQHDAEEGSNRECHQFTTPSALAAKPGSSCLATRPRSSNRFARACSVIDSAKSGMIR